MRAVAVIASDNSFFPGEIVMLSDIGQLPTDILEFIQSKAPCFKLAHSQTTGSEYYGHICPECGVLTGDHYLHGDVETPLNPFSKEEARLLTITAIPCKEPVNVVACCGVGAGDLILEFAKRSDGTDQ